MSGSQDGAKESGTSLGVRILGCIGGTQTDTHWSIGAGIDVTQLLFSEDHSDCCFGEQGVCGEGWAQGVQIGGNCNSARKKPWSFMLEE